MTEQTCLTCRYFYSLSTGPRCLNLRAPLLYGPGGTTNPAETVCGEWELLEQTKTRDDAQVSEQ